MKRSYLLYALLVFIAIFWVTLSIRGTTDPKLAAFRAQRDAWHQRCDQWAGQPLVTPEARACQAELDSMLAYAKQQGW